MTVLITGGAGFIGLNIAQHLLARGERVALFDLKAPPDSAVRFLRDLPGTLDIHVGDVCRQDEVAQALQKSSVTHVVHGAAVTAGQDRETRQAALIAQVNLGGTIAVLEAALAQGTQRVVLLSSGSVFGAEVKQAGLLEAEKDAPIPDSLYGITKYAAERTGLRYRRTRALDLVVARLGVTFGRWEYDTGLRDTLSVPLQLAQLAERAGHARIHEPLPDDWVYASDVARAIASMLDAAALPHAVYQVATGRRWSARRWCDRLCSAWPGFSYEVVSSPREANIGAHAPLPRPPFDISALRADLGFTPEFTEETAFADYLHWRAVQGVDFTSQEGTSAS